MVIYSQRILTRQPLRLALTSGGIGLCVVLMLFLLAVHRGVEEGSLDYIRHNETDLWVLQRNSWNILRGTSLLSTGYGIALERLPSIESASPILMLLPGVQSEGRVATVFLVGYEPGQPGGPPQMQSGRSVMTDEEIVIDKAFAARMGISMGDTVRIKDEPLTVVGLSSGTNAFVIQYAFVTIRRAQYIAGLSTITSCYLVRIKEGRTLTQARQEIQEDLPGVEVFDHAAFLQNNVREMESGFLPLLYIIAVIGAVVLTAILSLLLSTNVLERRKDFAVMKTLGAPKFFLPKTVVLQALMMSGLGNLVGFLTFFPLCRVVQLIVPEMTPESSFDQIALVVLMSVAVSLISSLISIQKLRRIYPLEVFS